MTQEKTNTEEKKEQAQDQNTNLDLNLNNSSIDDQFMIFQLGSELYGIEILKVQGIIRYTEPSTIPNTPPFVKGVINLRGEVIPVIDMRLRFGLDSVEYTESTVIINVMIGKKKYGLIVDSVSNVATIPKKDVQEDIDLQSNIDQTYIDGIGKINDEMVILINIARVFTKEELSQIDTAKS